VGLAFSVMGFLSLVWFLVRVIPSPAVRVSVPASRVPAGQQFRGLGDRVARLGLCLARVPPVDARLWQACLWGAAALALGAFVMASLPTVRAWRAIRRMGVLGVAKGLFPAAWSGCMRRRRRAGQGTLPLSIGTTRITRTWRWSRK